MLGLHPQHEIVRRLWHKHDRRKGHECIRPLILFTSGGMRGVYGGGVALALRELGLFDVFNPVLGISTGAAIAAYTIAGDEQAQIGSSVYLEECAGQGPTRYPFINPWRVWNTIDVDYIERVFTSGPKRIDVEGIKRSPQDFYIGAVNVATMQLEFINAKTACPGMLRAMKASMAVVGSQSEPVQVNGRYFLDGWLDPLPLKTLVRQFRPTDVLIVPNCTQQQLLRRVVVGPAQLALALLSLRYRSATITRGVLQQPDRVLRSLRWVTEMSWSEGINIEFLLAPDDRVNMMTTNPQKLQAAMEASKKSTLEALARG